MRKTAFLCLILVTCQASLARDGGGGDAMFDAPLAMPELALPEGPIGGGGFSPVMAPVTMPVVSPQASLFFQGPVAPTDTSRLFNIDTQTAAGNLQNFVNNQIFSGVAGGDVFMLTENKTHVEAAEGAQRLVSGQVLLDTGEKSGSIKTPLGELEVGKDAAARVEVTPNRSLKVSALSLHDGQIALQHEGGKIVLPISEGEEIEIALNDEYLIGIDGAADVIKADLRLGDRHVSAVKRPVQIRPFLAQTFTVAGATVSLGNHTQAGRFRDHIKAAAARQVANGMQVRQMGEGGAGSITLKAGVSRTAFVVDRNAKFESDGDLVILNEGSLVTEPQQHLRIRTPLGDVLVKKGTVIDLDVSAQVVRCRVCAGAMAHVSTNDGVIKVRPGTEIVLSERKLSAAELAPNDGIARRCSHSAQHKGLVVTASDFSITSLLLYNDHISGVFLTMGDDRKHFVDKLAKTAVAHEIATRHHGNWSYGN